MAAAALFRRLYSIALPSLWHIDADIAASAYLRYYYRRHADYASPRFSHTRLRRRQLRHITPAITLPPLIADTAAETLHTLMPPLRRRATLMPPLAGAFTPPDIDCRRHAAC